MTRLLITSGFRYTDIDALACAVALEEAMSSAGCAARAVLTGPPNYSVPRRYRSDGVFSTPPPVGAWHLALVDVSDPDQIPSFGSPAAVTKVYDHHAGFEDYWRRRIGASNTHIATVGAAATLIWREIQDLGVASAISDEAYRRIAHAIVSNTCDMKLSICTDDDRRALEDCTARASLPLDWKDEYFAEIDRAVLGDVVAALRDDTKTIFSASHGSLSVGQLELHAQHIAEMNLGQIARTMSADHIVLISSHAQEKTVCLTRRSNIADVISRYWGASVSRQADGLLVECDSLCLRKMLMPVLMA